MKKTLTILAATTALSAAITAPAWSGMRTGDSSVLPFAAVFDVGQDTMPLILARGDDDDDRKYKRDDDRDDDDRKYGRDEDDDDDCDDDDHDGDDDDCGTNARNAAPAGTVTPPQNGLFGTGAPPKAQMN